LKVGGLVPTDPGDPEDPGGSEILHGTSRLIPRILAVNSVKDLDVDQSRMDDMVFVHEGSDLFGDDVAEELAVIPEPDTNPNEPVARGDLQGGDPDLNTKSEMNQMKDIIWGRRYLLVGKGDAFPPPAKGVICNIDVNGAKPIAQRVRKLPPAILEKLFQLLKGLLGSGIIEVSESPWVSPIVVVLKKNGVDIRLCIDYRAVNAMTKLMIYPMPLINDLLENMNSILWFCSLGMASGFWVVRMTERAKKISAFVTPFSLFQWTWMPFGLKNAPQIYQRLIDNALYGVLKLSGEDRHRSTADVFKEGGGIHAPVGDRSVIRRRSYIDDIFMEDQAWDDMCAMSKICLTHATSGGCQSASRRVILGNVGWSIWVTSSAWTALQLTRGTSRRCGICHTPHT